MINSNWHKSTKNNFDGKFVTYRFDGKFVKIQFDGNLMTGFDRKFVKNRFERKIRRNFHEINLTESRNIQFDIKIFINSKLDGKLMKIAI